MIIALSLMVWTIGSIVYTISRIGYKHRSQGIRKYLEYVICPPALLIVLIVSTIVFWYRKPRCPVIVTTRCEDLHLIKSRKYLTQVRVFGEKGKYWCINIYSNDEPITDIHE